MKDIEAIENIAKTLNGMWISISLSYGNVDY